MGARKVDHGRIQARFSSFEEFLNNPPSLAGGVEVMYDGLPLHFYCEWSGHDTTFVSFNSGFPEGKTVRVPAWEGHGISSNIPVNRVLFSDPSLILDERIMMGWFGGNKFQKNLQDELLEFIRKLAEGTRIVFFGASAGGFAALRAASAIPDTTAVVVNSATNIMKSQRRRVENYLQFGWDLEYSTRDVDLPFQYSIVDTYADRIESNVIYIQNSADYYFLGPHFSPFIKAADLSNSINFLTPFLGKGHQPPSKQSLQNVLRTVVEEKQWSRLNHEVRRLILQS